MIESSTWSDHEYRINLPMALGPWQKKIQTTFFDISKVGEMDLEIIMVDSI